MTDAAIAIPNLLYRYADLIDAGDLRGAARLFRHGRLISGGERFDDEDAIVALWESWIRIYEDGTPRTRHLITNPIIELDEGGESAACRSQWTVLQAADGYPLQIVGSGRYHDRMRRIDGEWCFMERNYARIDLIGNTSAHMKRDVKDEVI